MERTNSKKDKQKKKSAVPATPTPLDPLFASVLSPLLSEAVVSEGDSEGSTVCCPNSPSLGLGEVMKDRNVY